MFSFSIKYFESCWFHFSSNFNYLEMQFMLKCARVCLFLFLFFFYWDLKESIVYLTSMCLFLNETALGHKMRVSLNERLYKWNMSVYLLSTSIHALLVAASSSKFNFVQHKARNIEIVSQTSSNSIWDKLTMFYFKCEHKAYPYVFGEAHLVLLEVELATWVNPVQSSLHFLLC